MTSGSPRRAARLLLVGMAGILALASVGAVLLRSSGGGGTVMPEECVGVADRECYTRAFTELVLGDEDPRPTVAAIAASAWKRGGFLLENCHGIMHTVGRRYASDAGVTLATLMDHLPRSNDPGCSAGFAHGLVTGVAPDLDPRRPKEATSVCGAASTRYQRYSCIHGFGHAFMRSNGDRLGPALDLCRRLGGQAPDCAQGAYHDFWFAVVGADEARLPHEAVTDPRRLCAAQLRQFVRPCWYRAFVDNRPEGFVVRSPEDVDGLCGGLRGLQREACVTAASVIGPPDPVEQLSLCARMRSPSDRTSCIRGTKVQNLLGRSTSTYVGLIRRCERFAGPDGAACYRWLGKTLAVVTDGEFGRTGCPELAAADARRQCKAGAARMEAALVTFS